MKRFIEALQAAGARFNLAAKAAVMALDGRIVATTAPGAAPSLARSIESVRQFFGAAWRPGDVAVMNDPDGGATHVCQLTAVAAVCKAAGEDIEAWVAMRCNGADFGGWHPGGYSPQAVDRWAEGARFEPAKLLAGGKLRREVSDLLALNSRVPETSRRLALCLAEQALQASRSTRTSALEANYARECRLAADAIAALAALEAVGTAAIRAPANWASPGQITARMTRDGSRLRVEVSAPPVSGRPINLAAAAAHDIVVSAVLAALGLEEMQTGAVLAVLDIDLADSMISARLPACVGIGRETGGVALFSACSQALAALCGRAAADAAQRWLESETAGALDWSSGRLAADAVSAILAPAVEAER